MKNFSITCPICPVIKENLIRYITDIKKFIAPDFIQQNYHKHFGYSLVLTFFSIWLLFLYAHLGETGVFFQLFIGGLGAYFVNWVRETFYAEYYKAPFDPTDVNMGSYGGIVGTILFLLTIAQLL